MPPCDPSTAAAPSPSPTTTKRDLAALLAAARPFLRGELELVDPALPSLVSVLRGAGAGECWHKHGTFLGHLLGVHRALKLWGAPDPVARCGLFHSAYSNSYVNLAIFDPASASRARVAALVGAPAERLVHLFCVVPRQPLIHDALLFRYSDRDLLDHLARSHASLRGRLEFAGDNPAALWPGEGKPGLWMNSISRMAALYALIVREEEIYLLERKSRGGGDYEEGRDEEIELVVPPVFDYCTRVLDANDQIVARDLYWEAVCGGGGEDKDKAGDTWGRVEKLLKESCEKNPFVGEPHLVLAQVYLNVGRYEDAEGEAEEGLRLVLEWGSSWDKRMSWEGWVSWGRVMLMKAKERSWPDTAWGIINLGLGSARESRRRERCPIYVASTSYKDKDKNIIKLEKREKETGVVASPSDAGLGCQLTIDSRPAPLLPFARKLSL
ncbi:uncharacterized protein LOC109727133 [Ananas comosus]|uniref:Uncharacterized protein LOC109727133 n=1 Tax=Ananas comosus TaxID=4615 RepID=A0A6P5GXV3_ANACO|nr:uncharacterized protein LOC109727133 [Ananas comosus]